MIKFKLGTNYIPYVGQEECLDKIEDRLAKIEGDLKLIKWMIGIIITMNIGIILMLIKVLGK